MEAAAIANGNAVASVNGKEIDEEILFSGWVFSHFFTWIENTICPGAPYILARLALTSTATPLCAEEYARLLDN